MAVDIQTRLGTLRGADPHVLRVRTSQTVAEAASLLMEQFGATRAFRRRVLATCRSLPAGHAAFLVRFDPSGVISAVVMASEDCPEGPVGDALLTEVGEDCFDTLLRAFGDVAPPSPLEFLAWYPGLRLIN